MSVIQNALHNPFILKIALTAILCFSMFLLAVFFMRRLRHGIQSEAETGRLSDGAAGFSLATYHGLAQQLGEQAKELQRLRGQHQAETATAAYINDAVLATLTCGVLFFDRMGLLRQANRSAKSLLGYSSPFSLHIRDLFRGVSRVRWQETGEEAHSSAPLVQAMQETLSSGAAFPRVRIDYRTPGGQKRVLGVSASAVRGKSNQVIGVSCVIDDLTEVAELSQEVHRSENLASLGEISAGLVHDFKKSLATVRGHSQALLRERPDPATRRYAQKIVDELDSLARIVDEFLEFASSTKD